jgi:hypothetical protein
VSEAFEQFTNVHLDAKFLAELPLETLLKSLVGLTFASGKFPKATQVRLGRPLGNEQSASFEAETRGHLDDFSAQRFYK